MNDGVELVLFFGPPFIGKTLHYFTHYSKTHTRISASEIFKEDKRSNLRLVILKAVEFLKKGKNVVIDDENWYIATRQSFTSLVKKKIPNCTFIIVQFIPEVTSGYQQCLWAREWALVEQTLQENKGYNSALLTESHEKLDCWFARRRSDLNPPEFPTAAEGFSILTVNQQLMCETHYKFNLPALFIQWHSILSDAQNENLSYKSTTPKVLNKWSEKNPSGRLIIIGPKTKNGKDIIDEETKTLLLDLASQLICPLYFTFIDMQYQLDEYCRLPQPGVLAFLQKLHTINLSHKGTMYVFSSDDHYRAASSVGIRTIKASKLFNHPHLIDSVYSGETTSALCFSQDVLQINCTTSCNETQGQSVTEAQIPYFTRAQKSLSPLAWKYCYGKVTGVCFKDSLTLERYQTQYELAVQCAQAPVKLEPKTSRTEYVLATLPQHSPTRSSLSSDKSLAARVMVGNTDLGKVAETPGRYFGGFQCKDNVFDMNVEVIEQYLKITCKCSGSSRQPYNIEVIFGDSSEFIEARCSCPDVAAKTGRCKHVIALLLNYKDYPSKSRVQPYIKASSSKKSRICEGNASSKSVEWGAQTLYCMSQEEFLKTAEEILEKDEEKQTREQSLVMELHNSNENKLKDDEKNRPATDKKQEDDVFKEALFSAIKGKLCRKVCDESMVPSFSEDTPTHKLSRHMGVPVTSIVIPDSLVRETVSVVPDTTRTVSTTLTHEEQETKERRSHRNSDSFEAFLDEMI